TTTRSSPHTGAHVVAPLAFEVHTKPSSMAHADEQPSSSLVLPSSHASGAMTTPSPHTGAHVDGEPVHAKPASMAHDEQPSPSARFASSHCSVPCTTPSPQRWHTLLPDASAAHVHPSSTPQVDEQPSPSSRLPSSHSSGEVTAPSPQPLTCLTFTSTGDTAPRFASTDCSPRSTTKPLLTPSMTTST